MATRVYVTDDDMKLAGRDRIWHNPLAIALQRELKDEHAAVTPRAVHLAERGIYALPEHAKRWLDLWDAGDAPSPFSFDLPI
jgi:hypothetical protein